MKRPETPLEAVNDSTSPRDKAFWLAELRNQCDEVGLEWTASEAARRERQARWLAAYVTSGGKTIASGVARVSAVTARKWAQEDPIFSPCVELAKEGLSDTILAEMMHRAVDGIEVTLYDRHGNPIGVERKYSDAVLIFMAKGLDFEKRWAQKVDLAQVSEERWRSAAASLMRDKPELLEMLDRLADEMVGGGSEG